MDIHEYTLWEVGYSGSLQDIANILEYPQEQVLFSGPLVALATSSSTPPPQPFSSHSVVRMSTPNYNHVSSNTVHLVNSC